MSLELILKNWYNIYTHTDTHTHTHSHTHTHTHTHTLTHTQTSEGMETLDKRSVQLIPARNCSGNAFFVLKS